MCSSDLDLTFGDLNFRVTHTGILRLEDSSSHEASEPGKFAEQEAEGGKIGSKPDSPGITNPRLFFVAMARRVPGEGSSNEEEEESNDKSWEELDAENGIQKQQTPPPQDREIGTDQAGEEAGSGPSSKQKEGRPQILVSAQTIEWVESLLAHGEKLPENATAEERQTYRYKLNQQRKRLNKLQKTFDSAKLDRKAGESDGARPRPMGKARSRTRDMPPETMDHTKRNLELELASSGAVSAGVPPKTPQDFVLQAQTYLMAIDRKSVV